MRATLILTPENESEVEDAKALYNTLSKCQNYADDGASIRSWLLECCYEERDRGNFSKENKFVEGQNLLATVLLSPPWEIGKKK
jgi:hypothetical protein